MERAEKVILTNLCMIQDGTKVLVQDKVGKGADGIIFPGGHVEEHEAVVDSVIREMKEETGLTIENPKLCGIKEWVNEDGTRYIVFLFKNALYCFPVQNRQVFRGTDFIGGRPRFLAGAG